MKKSLQKLTESEVKFNLLLEKKKVAREDIDALLTKEETYQFEQYLTNLSNEKKGEDLEKLLEQISEILTRSTRNQLWEHNHYKITAGISRLMEENGNMPTKNQIATEVGLSRQTISKHLKEYQTHPLFVEERMKFKFMADNVLAKVYNIAVSCGDIKAARLYFEVMGYLGNQPGQNNTFNTQNNFIHINQFKLTQESIKQLAPQQIDQIEGVLKRVMPALSPSGEIVTNEGSKGS